MAGQSRRQTLRSVTTGPGTYTVGISRGCAE